MRKQVFDIPYIGVDKNHEHPLLVGKDGECSVIIRLNNPVIRYAASPSAYDEFHYLVNNIVKVLGGGYILQKLDIFYKMPYPAKTSEAYLQARYFEHFAGREQLQIGTYLVITRQGKKGKLFTYDPKGLREFMQATGKALDILLAGKASPVVLNEGEINLLILRLLSMNFAEGPVSLDSLLPSDTEITLGDRVVRNISLINIDTIDLPSEVSTHATLNEPEALRGFPVDLLSFFYRIPSAETVVYNQVIEIPNQQVTLRKLELKKKRHSGIPDPANLLCVEDIDRLMADVARDNQLLVNCHFNISVAAEKANVQRAQNFIESALFQMGIIPSKNAYNQLELFRTLLPGNGVELKSYDWFLTTCDAALCLFFKESIAGDEPSDFLLRFTDREGIPVGIDLADLPMHTGRINNRNKFVLGPSGSGKSFFMNALTEQYLMYNVDAVIVDVGHSYSGLCAYYGGKYITYSEEKPITMNPFAISEAEYNLEKKDFLVTLVALLWKGAEGNVNNVERDVLTAVISGYYTAYFTEGVIEELSFNSFYRYALARIPDIKKGERIPFDIDEFRYVLKKFSKGGEYGTILNEAADASLLTERLVVYEIDNVIENATLLPIVTLIIMDVFIQKMRHRKQQRKVLILEEAWRALMSPIMANFLLYLNKTVRKFWGEIIEVTQELSDIISNPIVKDSIINNSDTVILLDQRKFRDNYAEIAKMLAITETEKRKIFTINQLDNREGRSRFNEVYIRRGSVGEVYGVETCKHQYYVYTTEKPEKNALEIYAAAFGSYQQALDAFISDLDRFGSPAEFIYKVNQSGKPLYTPSI